MAKRVTSDLRGNCFCGSQKGAVAFHYEQCVCYIYNLLLSSFQTHIQVECDRDFIFDVYQWLSLSIIVLSIYLSIYLSIDLSIYLSIYQSIYHISTNGLSISLWIGPTYPFKATYTLLFTAHPASSCRIFVSSAYPYPVLLIASPLLLYHLDP